MTDDTEPDHDPHSARIAIACQGGGSHTAFTAGVLRRVLLEELNHCRGCGLVGFSGTSGGAICALLGWYGLMSGGDRRAAELLEAFWERIAANAPWDRVVNSWVNTTLQWLGAFGDVGVSPYLNPVSGRAQQKLRDTIEAFVDFERIPQLFEESCPMLLVGAVDVESGHFHVFKDEEVTADAVLASTALPTLFPAVEVEGHMHWDGLLSQNPPIRDLPQTGCDEIWVVQINPQRRAEDLPKSISEIQNRRNELAGNLSLNQEIFYIETINELIADGVINDPDFRHITVRRIEMARSLGRMSKFDRSPRFLRELMDHGAEQAEEALKDVEAYQPTG